jgi:hypothetical protein
MVDEAGGGQKAAPWPMTSDIRGEREKLAGSD